MDRFPKIFQQQEQLVWIDRRFLEPKVLMEAAGRIVNSMDHHGSDGDNISRFFNARQCIEEQRFAQASPLLSSIHRKPRQQHDADGMIGQAFGDPLRTLVLVHGTGRERVVADGSITVERYVCLRGVRLLIRPSELLQPLIAAF